MATKGRQEERRIVYDDILSSTGISNTTLTRLANNRAGRIYISTIDRLCSYFDCQPGDLFVYIEDPMETT